jgi:hypothetical protein
MSRLAALTLCRTVEFLLAVSLVQIANGLCQLFFS